ncbi:uncharacterized protein LOC122197460 [Lactuca sativa]|uniref:uncharacterized protein LOC122197460 n=1 Tax=Lactuca sativa TaxID=4236 RepID=UPI001C6907E2|nr:uncharacterized protein LOC122197460 [Lactuca sativa]
MECLNIAMKDACNKDLFHGINIPKSNTSLSHIFYVDDVIFVGEWPRGNLKNLAIIIRCFHASSHLKVNFSKSKVFGIGVSDRELASSASILGCDIGAFPFTYLEVPVGANMNLIKNWNPIIDHIQTRLSSWTENTLSIGRLLTLVKSVMGSFPLYFFSIFKSPIGVIESLEKTRRENTKEILVGWK